MDKCDPSIEIFYGLLGILHSLIEIRTTPLQVHYACPDFNDIVIWTFFLGPKILNLKKISLNLV